MSNQDSNNNRQANDGLDEALSNGSQALPVDENILKEKRESDNGRESIDDANHLRNDDEPGA